jgi:hypothetical protein
MFRGPVCSAAGAPALPNNTCRRFRGSRMRRSQPHPDRFRWIGRRGHTQSRSPGFHQTLFYQPVTVTVRTETRHINGCKMDGTEEAQDETRYRWGWTRAGRAVLLCACMVSTRSPRSPGGYTDGLGWAPARRPPVSIFIQGGPVLPWMNVRECHLCLWRFEYRLVFIDCWDGERNHGLPLSIGVHAMWEYQRYQERRQHLRTAV